MKENTPLDRFLEQFHIGTYCLQENARTEQHIRDIRDCGIDLVIGLDNDRPALNLFHKYRIQAIVSGVIPGWFGGHGENAGTLQITNRPEAYEAGAQAFADHPAIVGIDMGDEPSSLDFPCYGQLIKLNRTLFPGKLLYLNIYPSYGMLAVNDKAQRLRELGTDTYRDYLEAYCQHIDLPYLSFDHYVFSSDTQLFLQDLQEAAACCKAYGKKLFVVLQVNSHQEDVALTADQLRFQALTALAFGPACISWACYCAGWWYHNVLDAAGEKTAQYHKLKTVNTELRCFAEQLHPCSWEQTVILESDRAYSIGGFTQFTSSVPAVLGVFSDEAGRPALFYSPLDYGRDSSSLRFRCRASAPLNCRTLLGNRPLSATGGDLYELPLEYPQPCLLTFF